MKIHYIFFLLPLALSNPNPCMKNKKSCLNNIEKVEFSYKISDNNLKDTENIQRDSSKIPKSCEEAAYQFSECSIKKYSSAEDLCINGYNECLNVIKSYKEFCHVESNATKQLEVQLKSKCELDSSGQLCPFSQNILDIEFGLDNKIDFSLEAIEANCYDQKCRNIILDYLMLCKMNYSNDNNVNNLDLNMIGKHQIDHLINYINSSQCKNQINTLQKVLKKINNKIKRSIKKKRNIE